MNLHQGLLNHDVCIMYAIMSRICCIPIFVSYTQIKLYYNLFRAPLHESPLGLKCEQSTDSLYFMLKLNFNKNETARMKSRPLGCKVNIMLTITPNVV